MAAKKYTKKDGGVSVYKIPDYSKPIKHGHYVERRMSKEPKVNIGGRSVAYLIDRHWDRTLGGAEECISDFCHNVGILLPGRDD